MSKRIEIGNTVIRTNKFDDNDLKLIADIIYNITQNNMLQTKWQFLDLIKTMEVKNAIRNYLEGVK